MKILPQTLVVAIQCVAAESRRLERTLEGDTSSDSGGLEQLLLSFDLAAANLKSAYEEASSQYGELPKYEELIHAPLSEA